MNKSKFFMAIGSVVLASAAFMAAKPAKKVFATFTGRFNLIGPGGNFTIVHLTGTHFTAAAGKTIQLITKDFGGVIQTLVTRTNGSLRVHYK